jgi:hypothetical protein
VLEFAQCLGLELALAGNGECVTHFLQGMSAADAITFESAIRSHEMSSANAVSAGAVARISPVGERKVAAYCALFTRDIQQASSCEIYESQSPKD